MKHCYPGSLVLWFTNNTHFLLLKTVHRAWYTGKVHKRCTAFIVFFFFLFIANCLINNYDASSVKATTDWGENGNLWKICLMESAEKKSLECVLKGSVKENFMPNVLLHCEPLGIPFLALSFHMFFKLFRSTLVFWINEKKIIPLQHIWVMVLPLYGGQERASLDEVILHYRRT